MKLRFSILTLLLIMAYVALTFAAATNPESLWRKSWLVAWLLVVAYLAALAFNADSPSGRAFGRVAIVCGAIYLLLPFAVPAVGYGGMPDVWLTGFVLGGRFSGSRSYMPVAATMQLSTSQAFGLLGGMFALWQHRVREKQEKSAK